MGALLHLNSFSKKINLLYEYMQGFDMDVIFIWINKVISPPSRIFKGHIVYHF